MRLSLLTLLLLLQMTGSALAMKQDMPHYDYSAFRLLPVAHQGRIKPLSIYAQQELLNIAHMREWHQRPAHEWLAQVIFSPEVPSQRTGTVVSRLDPSPRGPRQQGQFSASSGVVDNRPIANSATGE